ncbi:MAG TPA: hypothetical protein VGL99_19510 [Chloroflexota bacterium]|jgi:hypothetical protein
MFDFLRRSRRPEFSTSILQALTDARRTPDLDPRTLTVLQRRGSYSGRAVDYFRVFDPAPATAKGILPRRFEDLDVHPELILGAGHVEHGGAVVLTTRSVMPTMSTPDRLLANRAAHRDDERVVFGDGVSS